MRDVVGVGPPRRISSFRKKKTTPRARLRPPTVFFFIRDKEIQTTILNWFKLVFFSQILADKQHSRRRQALCGGHHAVGPSWVFSLDAPVACGEVPYPDAHEAAVLHNNRALALVKLADRTDGTPQAPRATLSGGYMGDQSLLNIKTPNIGDCIRIFQQTLLHIQKFCTCPSLPTTV
jgi:hypothetical protein